MIGPNDGITKMLVDNDRGGAYGSFSPSYSVAFLVGGSMAGDKLWRFLDRFSTIVVPVIAILIVWQYINLQGRSKTSRKTLSAPTDAISLSEAPLIGAADATAGMIVFSDFQCPFCGKFARETWPVLRDRYVKLGRLAVAFWNVPLETIHPLAFRVAEAGDCAARQARFWDLHDVLFGVGQQGPRSSSDLSDEGVRTAAAQAGLNMDQLGDCLATQKGKRIRAELAAAEKWGIQSTPTFFIGRLERQSLRVSEIVSGAKPISEFTKALETVLTSR